MLCRFEHSEKPVVAQRLTKAPRAAVGLAVPPDLARDEAPQRRVDLIGVVRREHVDRGSVKRLGQRIDDPMYRRWQPPSVRLMANQHPWLKDWVATVDFDKRPQPCWHGRAYVRGSHSRSRVWDTGHDGTRVGGATGVTLAGRLIGRRLFGR